MSPRSSQRSMRVEFNSLHSPWRYLQQCQNLEAWSSWPRKPTFLSRGSDVPPLCHSRTKAICMGHTSRFCRPQESYQGFAQMKQVRGVGKQEQLPAVLLSAKTANKRSARVSPTSRGIVLSPGNCPLRQGLRWIAPSTGCHDSPLVLVPLWSSWSLWSCIWGYTRTRLRASGEKHDDHCGGDLNQSRQVFTHGCQLVLLPTSQHTTQYAIDRPFEHKMCSSSPRFHSSTPG